VLLEKYMGVYWIKGFEGLFPYGALGDQYVDLLRHAVVCSAPRSLSSQKTTPVQEKQYGIGIH
jgi:hypothetical protein